MVMRWLRARVPASVVALGQDRRARTTLLAAVLALAAAGIDPPVIEATGNLVQSNLRLYPAFQALVTLGVVAGAAVTLSGGAIGDLYGRRRYLLAGLAVLALADTVGALIPGDTALLLSRALAGPAAGFIIPLALANVAVAFQGPMRATALGIASAALGGAVAVSPIVAEFLFAEADRVASLMAAAAAAAGAAWLVRRTFRESDARREFRVGYVVMQAAWVLALLAIATGVFGVDDGPAVVVRVGLIGAGLLTLGVVWWWRRARRASLPRMPFDARPVGVAVVVGVILAAIQAGPLLQLPLTLQLGLGYPPIAAALAVLPAAGAMLVAGPVAGSILPRVGPRALLAGSLAAVGGADLALGQLSGRGGYMLILVPLLVLGLAFTVGTTMRTALIFNGVPRHLPATAAALNDTSIVLGVALGASGLTTYVTATAVATYLQQVPGAGTASVEALRQALNVVAVSGSDAVPNELAGHLQAGLASSYAAAAAQGMTALGLLGLVTAVVTWLALGRRDPLMDDELGQAAQAPVDSGVVP